MDTDRGVIAVFKTEQELLRAAKEAREKKNYKKYDAFTPYPVHGLDDAMGIKRSWIPYVTFVAGVGGAMTALALEIWTSAVDWPLNVGGKPYVSLPAFIPITFELTVLFGGLCTVGALFAACGLPNLKKKPVHPRVTADRFVLFVPGTEENYNENDVKNFLQSFKPEEVSVVME